MNNEANMARIITLVNKNSSLALCISVNPSIDTMGAALALYFGLTALGKNVNISASAQIPLQLPLVGTDKIKNKLASNGDSLVVSFPYVEGAIDKVTYTIENGYFNLLIQPKESAHKLNPSQVAYAYTGGKIDTIITIDAPALTYLGDIYTANQQEFSGKDIINIDRHITNTQFGTINLIEKNISSTSEMILRILQALSIEITPDIATNLYMGIRAATNNFTAYTVNAETFENSALLLKAGASKKTPTPQFIKKTAQSFTPSFHESSALPEEFIEHKENSEETTPQDWLKPKIFKGSSNLV